MIDGLCDGAVGLPTPSQISRWGRGKGGQRGEKLKSTQVTAKMKRGGGGGCLQGTSDWPGCLLSPSTI